MSRVSNLESRINRLEIKLSSLQTDLHFNAREYSRNERQTRREIKEIKDFCKDAGLTAEVEVQNKELTFTIDELEQYECALMLREKEKQQCD